MCESLSVVQCRRCLMLKGMRSPIDSVLPADSLSRKSPDMGSARLHASDHCYIMEDRKAAGG
jgi:hypothetical protein